MAKRPLEHAVHDAALYVALYLPGAHSSHADVAFERKLPGAHAGVGDAVGAAVGNAVGAAVGCCVGDAVGAVVGDGVGAAVCDGIGVLLDVCVLLNCPGL